MTLLYKFTLFAFLAAGMTWLLAFPAVALTGMGHSRLTFWMHLLTLGGFLTGAYLLQQRMWPVLYGRGTSRFRLLSWLEAWLPAAVWAFHVPGVVVMQWGFFTQSIRLSLLGGHYLVPTGIVLAVIHGWWALWRRPRGAPRHLWAHLPGVGLLVAMSLGSLLVMDLQTGKYGIYFPSTIFVHLIAGGFLFMWPQLLAAEAAETVTVMAAGRDAGGESTGAVLPTVVLLRLYGRMAAATGGVFAAVLALAPGGHPIGLPAGLALLGALLLWSALPQRTTPGAFLVRVAENAGALTVGVLLLHAAIRVSRGVPGWELTASLNAGVLLFFTGYALPALLDRLRSAGPAGSAGSAESRENQESRNVRSRLPRESLPHRSLWHGSLLHGLFLLGAALILAGQILSQGVLVQGGAALWLAGLFWWGWEMFRAWRNTG